MGRARVAVFVLGAFVGSGCATTTGSSWVNQPEPGPFAADDFALQASGEHWNSLDEPRTSDWASNDELEERRVRPRLDRTVTLGEVEAGYAERAAAPPPANGTPVSVTVNNYVNTPNAYDGYYGAPYFVGDFRPGHGTRPSRPSAAPTRPGQNWPAPPSYGPAFPFKTAPASPWAPAR